MATKSKVVAINWKLTKVMSKIVALTIFVVFHFVSINASAQSSLDKNTRTVPSLDTFTPADGLITLDTDSPRDIRSDTVRIYDDDGLLWYEFSLDRNNRLYYKRNPKPEFQPYASLDHFQMAIRLKAVSPNWYEVIVDESSQKTKYVWVGEFFLRRETFEKYVLSSTFVSFDKEKNPVRETPDDQSEYIRVSEKDRYSPTRTDGEWLRVRITRIPLDKQVEFGWIRWKKDRDILISFILNCRDCR